MDGNAGVTYSIAGERGEARRHIVGRDYFATTGIPILQGREFRKQDQAGDTTAVMVSEELARRAGIGDSALGRVIEIENGDVSPGLGALPGTFDLRPDLIEKGSRRYEVVGIVRDVAEDFVVHKKHPVVYFPLRTADFAHPSLRGVTLLVRSVPGFDATGSMHREIAAIDPNVTAFNARTMSEHIDQFMSPLRAASWTYGVIGVFGLILASVGLAGVTAYSVSRRGREIGIRMALGAQKRNVLGLVLRESVILIAAGSVLGLAGAWAGIRALSGLFFTVASVETADPMLLAGAPLLLISVALAACYLPARRSAKIDPAIALRQE
jgi:ABC-type antimicrobial peptide transport system permease subunit